MAIADGSIASLSLIYLSYTSLAANINHNGSTRGTDCLSCKLFIDMMSLYCHPLSELPLTHVSARLPVWITKHTTWCVMIADFI